VERRFGLLVLTSAIGGEAEMLLLALSHRFMTAGTALRKADPVVDF
jgi:hypothetical protein